MAKEVYIEALGDFRYECEPDIFKEFDKYKNKKIEFRIGAERYTLYTPLAILASVDPWTIVFIQNLEFRKIMSKPSVLEQIAELIEKQFIPNIDASEPLALEKLEEYLPVRYAIWKHYNAVFFKQIKEKLKDAEKVLEIGCGTGTLCKLISDEFPAAKIVGIDKNKVPLEYAKEHSKAKNIDYYTGTISSLEETLNEKYGKFDICLALVIPKLDPFETVLKHVKEGGHYILTTPPKIFQIRTKCELDTKTEKLDIKIHPWVQKQRDFIIYIKKIK